MRAAPYCKCRESNSVKAQFGDQKEGSTTYIEPLKIPFTRVKVELPSLVDVITLHLAMAEADLLSGNYSLLVEL